MILRNLKVYGFLFFTVFFLYSCTSDNEEKETSFSYVGRMMEGRMAPGSVAKGSFLYVLGGSVKDRGYTDTCEFMKIKNDGSLMVSRKTSSFNIPRGYIAAVENNGFIYAVGGANGEHGVNLHDTVERAEIMPDGSLSKWVVEKEKMYYQRRGVTAVVYNGYLYVIGGFNGVFLDTVERAKINKDGSLSPFEDISPMLYRRYIQSTAVSDNKIYVIGGHKKATGGAYGTVEVLEINSDNSYEGWREVSSLNVPRYDAWAVSAKGYVFEVAGYDGRSINNVEKAKILEDGTLGKWEITDSLNTARNGVSAVAHNNVLYAIGGTYHKRYLNSIEAVKVNEKGEFISFKR